MKKFNLKNITEELVDTFFLAGKLAQEISKQGVKITIKSDKTPVTDGDIKVNTILCEKISKLTSDIPIVSEETVNLNKKNENKTFWLIDPIDGTKDYIKKKDEYTLNACLIINLEPVIGVVYAPAKDRMFFSYGKGTAFEIHNGIKKALNCKKLNESEIIGLTNSDKTPNEILNIYKKYKVTKTIKMSSSLKFCLIASGEADIYAAQPRAFEWDIAAGHAILDHAGGSVTDFNEKKFLYGKSDYRNTAIIAKRSTNIER